MALHIYLPQDRLRAFVRGESLPYHVQGAALFTDISGFTPLTEALRNSLGSRRGAEELTRQINNVYSVLVAEIERYGGSVIGFAGDAMLCWFDSAHSANASCLAVACGLSLQQGMHAFDAITLPDHSTTSLSLKVAIASGPARRFVVGDPDILLMDALAGATVARTSMAEHLAQRGEVLVDSATADALGAGLSIREWREDIETHECFGVVESLAQLIEPPPPSPLEFDEIEAEKLHPWLHKHIIETEKIGGDSLLAEFRPCTVLFLRFPGIDYDSDEAGMQLDMFIRRAQSIVTKHGGSFLQIVIGDKGSYAYINFGITNAHEDDIYRAVKTALELRQDTPILGFIEPLQIGVTHGTLFAGSTGGITRKTFGAMGDDVNLAARLMTTAVPGEILLSGAVHKAVETRFVFEPRPPLPMKGKAEPLPVFAVSGERKQRAIRLQEPNYALPMVGRQNELRLIEEKLNVALEGKGQVVGIVAEAGMGKSRLLAEVIRLARRKGCVGYGGACQSEGVHTPYLVWKSIWSAFFDIDPELPLRKQVRWLEGELEDRAPSRVEAMPLLNVVLDLDIPENEFTNALEPKFRKSALHALFEECLRASAQDAPLLIVIDDMQWIDALSLDLLEELAKMLADARICFVLAYRPSGATEAQLRVEKLANFTQVELSKLTHVDAEQAVRAKLAQLYPARTGSFPHALVDTMMERAEGNPFYLEELLNYLHDRGLDPFNSTDLKQIELPDSLHTLILSRVDQLSENEKAALRAASIIGRFFRAAWLIDYYPALGELFDIKTELDKLSGMEITPLDTPEPELAYLFKHIIMHEVAYESLPFSLRAKLHEQLANYLERQIAAGNVSETPLLNLLVHHYTHTDNRDKQRVYLQKAGDAALNLSAFHTSVDCFTRLLDLTPKNDPTHAGLALKLADAYFNLGDFPATCAAIEKAQAAAQTDADRASALTLLGNTTSNLGSYPEAEPILVEAVSLARNSSDQRTLCRALYAYGSNCWRMGKMDEAKCGLQESLSLARVVGDVTRELFALNGLGGVALNQGDTSKAEQLWQEVYARATEVGNRDRAMAALNNLGAVADARHDVALEQKYTQQALAMAREIGAQRSVAMLLINLGYVDTKLGNLSAARAGLREGLGLALRLGVQPFVVLATINFAELVHAEGNTDRALALYGLARRQPAWGGEHQRQLDLALESWALTPSEVNAGLARGAELDWDRSIIELLKI